MLAKSWKKICLVILIIACLWNIISKIMYEISLKRELDNLEDKQIQEYNTNNV